MPAALASVIIVTGTKRSGTSLWMQILRAAGFPVFGEQFPSNWGETIKDANRGGFWESSLRRGIFYRTNPHPPTGQFFRPDEVERHAVKVFIPGLVRTDYGYITRVIAGIRSWREYHASVERLNAMEDEANAKLDPPLSEPLTRMPPSLEWFHENAMLLRDLVTRRYPVHVQSFTRLIEQPDELIPRAIKWLGGGNVEAAVRAVQPSQRTQQSIATPKGVPDDYAAVFDEIYETASEERDLRGSLFRRVRDLHQALTPEIARWQRKIRGDLARRQRAAMEIARKRGSSSPDPGPDDPPLGPDEPEHDV